MKLSTRCRYATLALFDIAFHSNGEATQVRQIAQRQEIPARFLEQIFQDLRRAELVDGKRGRNGGYFLRKTPADISIADIIQATDGPIEVNFQQGDEGTMQPGSAPRDSRYVSGLIWTEVTAKIKDIYASYTLEALVQRAEQEGIPRGQSGYMYFI